MHDTWLAEMHIHGLPRMTRGLRRHLMKVQRRVASTGKRCLVIVLICNLHLATGGQLKRSPSPAVETLRTTEGSKMELR